MSQSPESMADNILNLLRPLLVSEIRREVDSRVLPALRGIDGIKDRSKLAFSMEEAAQMIGISASTLKPLVYSGQIKSVKIPGGQRRLISREALVEWLRATATSRPTEDSL